MERKFNEQEYELRRMADKYTNIFERLRQSIPKEVHKKDIESLKMNYENQLTEIKNEHKRIVENLTNQLSEINNKHTCKHNERGAGRKKKATTEIVDRILELHSEGYSQSKIAKIISDEKKVSISRSVIGGIIRENILFPLDNKG